MTNAPSREEVAAVIARLLDRRESYPYEEAAVPLCRQAARALTALLARFTEVERERDDAIENCIGHFIETARGVGLGMRTILEIASAIRARAALQHKDQQG